MSQAGRAKWGDEWEMMPIGVRYREIQRQIDEFQQLLEEGSTMSNNPGDKQKTSYEIGKEWWEAQNHIREQASQAPSAFLNEPEGIQANRKHMQAYAREQEELRLLRNIGTLASQVREANLGIWQGPFEELELACYELEVFRGSAVKLPEAEGRLADG